jgi:hypothetical protein
VSAVEPAALADEIDRRIRALPDRSVEPVRRVRREYSIRLRSTPAVDVLALAVALAGRQRWVAYELLHHHPGGLACLGVEDVERLGRGLDGNKLATGLKRRSPARGRRDPPR